MVGTLQSLAILNLVGGFLGMLALLPDPTYRSSPPLAFLPSSLVAVEGVLGCVALLVVAEVLEHLRAIRTKIAPAVVEPVEANTFTSIA
jgi:hypothetical protein